MQLNSEIVLTPPRASATVVLLRDAPQKGLEVFLLRRHTASAVLGGAYVFPGGKLDAADCDPALHAHSGCRPAELARRTRVSQSSPSPHRDGFVRGCRA